jgi:hypothetical protein
MTGGSTNGKDPRRPRVFGIGLNKTGTSSLHTALEILGFDSLHWGGPTVRAKVEAARDAGLPMLDHLDPKYDAFSDILPIAQSYALLDRQYPGSHFVLTVRPLDEWLDSRRRHVETNQRRQAAGEYSGTFVVVDEDAWRAEWITHTGGVREYFVGRSDYAELDLSTTVGWEPLCTLLDVPEPSDAYPCINRDDRRPQRS